MLQLKVFGTFFCSSIKSKSTSNMSLAILITMPGLSLFCFVLKVLLRLFNGIAAYYPITGLSIALNHNYYTFKNYFLNF